MRLGRAQKLAALGLSLASMLVLVPAGAADAGVYTYMSTYSNCQRSGSEITWRGVAYSDKYEGTLQMELYGLAVPPVLLDSETRPFKPNEVQGHFFRMDVQKSKKFSQRFDRYRAVATFRRGENWTSGTHEC